MKRHEPGDTYIVKSYQTPVIATFSTVADLVHFLRGQRAGSSWEIRHMRGERQIDTYYPHDVLDENWEVW